MDAKAITRPAAVPLPLLIYGSKNSKRRTLNVTGDPSYYLNIVSCIPLKLIVPLNRNDDDSNWFSGEEQWASLSFGDSENFNATHFCQDCNYYDDFFAVGERSDGFIEDFQNSFTSDYKEEDDLAPFLAFVKIAPAHRRFQALGRRIRKRRKRKFPKIIERSWEDTPDEHFQCKLAYYALSSIVIF